MIKTFLDYVLLTFLLIPAICIADNEQRFKNELKNRGLEVESVKQSVAPGIFEVVTQSGLFYTTKDMRFLIHGKLYDIHNNMRNESEATLTSIRLAGIKALECEFRKDQVCMDDYSNFIEYKASREAFKVTVFTDTDCGYCRKLHSQMAKYNELGITVRYLAFPRAGLSSNAAALMQKVWCAVDTKTAMNQAKRDRRISVDSRPCHIDIKNHYDLGVKIGISGTPAIVMENGGMIAGYAHPDQLLEYLESRQ